MAYEDDYGPNTSNPQETLSFIWDDYGLSWLQTKMTSFLAEDPADWDADADDTPTETAAKLFTSDGDRYTYKSNASFTTNDVVFTGGANSDMVGVTLSFKNKMSFGKTETDSGTLVYKEGLETTDTVDDFSFTSKYSRKGTDNGYTGTWSWGSKESFSFGAGYKIEYDGSESGTWSNTGNGYSESYTETIKGMKVVGADGDMLSFSAAVGYTYANGVETVTNSSLKNITLVSDGVKIVTKSLTSPANTDLVATWIGGDDAFDGSAPVGGDAFIQGAIARARTSVLDSNNTITLTAKTGTFGESIYAGAGNDSITGGNNSDHIDGGLGADTMAGGKGDDFYFVDNAGDKVKESAKQGNDTVYASIDYTLTSNVENLYLLDDAPMDSPLRGTFSAQLNGTGNTLANVIVGNSGNNRLDGKAGADTLTGGAGDDIFVFSTTLGSKNLDTIIDFGDGNDKLELSGSAFKALFKAAGVTGGLTADHLVVGEWETTPPAATDSNDYLLFNTYNSTLYYDANGSGKGGAVAVVQLIGVNELSIDQIQIS